MSNELTKAQLDLPIIDKQDIPEVASFADSKSFEHAQRVAKMLSASNLIPKDYQGNIQNTMIALEMANRIGASPLMVMQNLYVINGRPSWSSTFIIAALNASKRFSPIRFETGGEGEDYGCVAYATDPVTKEKLDGPRITIKMATAEGWLSKPGSKWKTMPELMIRYRAAAFFGRLYAPDIMMGMQTAEEAIDIIEYASNDQLAFIENLLHTSTLEDRQRGAIESEVSAEMTAARASEIITTLQCNQQETDKQALKRLQVSE